MALMLSATESQRNKSQKLKQQIMFYVCVLTQWKQAGKWAKHHTGHIMATKQLSTFLEKRQRQPSKCRARSKNVCLANDSNNGRRDAQTQHKPGGSNSDCALLLICPPVIRMLVCNYKYVKRIWIHLSFKNVSIFHIRSGIFILLHLLTHCLIKSSNQTFLEFFSLKHCKLRVKVLFMWLTINICVFVYNLSSLSSLFFKSHLGAEWQPLLSPSAAFTPFSSAQHVSLRRDSRHLTWRINANTGFNSEPKALKQMSSVILQAVVKCSPQL